MKIVPISLRAANAFVEINHRHHKASRGHKFSIAIEQDGKIIGVAIAGRPVARHLDNGQNLEILRVCTDGTENACSKLLAACRKAGTAMGYQKIITYTLQSESGRSVIAAGFKKVAVTNGGSWSSDKRPREDKHPLDPKIRWEWP